MLPEVVQSYFKLIALFQNVMTPLAVVFQIVCINLLNSAPVFPTFQCKPKEVPAFCQVNFMQVQEGIG